MHETHGFAGEPYSFKVLHKINPFRPNKTTSILEVINNNQNNRVASARKVPTKQTNCTKIRPKAPFNRQYKCIITENVQHTYICVFIFVVFQGGGVPCFRPRSPEFMS